jgi:deoxyribodipyrimidine photo-lyase
LPPVPAARRRLAAGDKCYRRALVWFRRDLRDFDHAALHGALTSAGRVFCAFVFDREILDALPRRDDRRVEFIRESLVELAGSLARRGGGLVVLNANARDAIPALAQELGVDAVFANRDYEPQAIARDDAVAARLAAAGIVFVTAKDQVIFERDEIVTRAGSAYTVFTPYREAWLRALTPADVTPHAIEVHADALAPPPRASETGVPTLADIGFVRTNLRELGVRPGMSGGAALFADFRERIDSYRETRDFPALRGSSGLSVHVRFGTVSIRELAGHAHARSLARQGEGALAWLSELVWREFFAQVLWHRPDVVTTSFRPEYVNVRFPNDRERFSAWCSGRTGYPIVDAAMRELDATGGMHNRLRMVAASFLVKDLLVDWRWGERWFADHLLDFDLASNNGNWQWAASTGCDAQPWFRIFNPLAQSRRFDAAGTFIRRYVPEVASLSSDEIHAPWLVPGDVQRAKGVVIGRDYPPPIVDHAKARDAALALYRNAR